MPYNDLNEAVRNSAAPHFTYKAHLAARVAAASAGAGIVVCTGGGVMATSISTKPIPRTGELLPVIGLGTWQTFDVGRSESGRAPLREVLRDFARLGGKVIDSSTMYDQSESVVGDVAAELKLHNQLFIATKSIVAHDQQVLTIHFNPCQRSSIRQQSKLI